MNEDLRFDAPPTICPSTPYATLDHTNNSTARRIVRLVPLVVALVLVAAIVFAVVLPVTHAWRASSAGRVLVGP